MAEVGTEGSGADSTIKIEVVKEKEQVKLTIEVVDKESGAPLSGVVVKLTDPDHPDTPPITGSPEGVSHTTDDTGKIVISLFPDPDKRYQIKVDHTGYRPYVGDIFMINADTEKLVELERQTPDPGGDTGSYVYYHAGAGGGLDGVERERVAYNGSPKKVPAPVPDEGYTFAGWMLDDKFVEPESLKVRKTIHLYAVFEFNPVPIPTPTPTAPPTQPPVSPTPSPPPVEPPVETGGPSRPQPTESRRPTPPGAIGQSGSDGTSGGGSAPGGGPDDNPGPAPETIAPDPSPDIPAFHPETLEPPAEGEHDHEDSSCFLHWWILLCIALTAALGLLRLWMIHRHIKELEHEDQEEEKELTLK